MADETTNVEDQESTDDTNTDTTDETKTDDAPEAKDDEAGDEDGDEGDELPEHVTRKELKAARAEAAKYRTQLRETQEALAKAKTPEEFEAALAESSTKISALEKELVAAKFKLPDILAKRLVGTTREELEADAKELAKQVRPGERRDVSGGLDPSDDSSNNSDVEAAVKAALKRGRAL